MEEEPKSRRRRILDDVEEIVGDVSKVVRVAVIRGSEAAESVGENLKETIKDTIHGSHSTRENVVMVRVDKESLAKLDDLVEAGLANSRSEAAAYLIGEGVKSRKGMFDKIAEKIENIRKAKEELREILEQEDNPPASEV
ncbi:MAG: hypothetical protein IIB15_03995 [Chloroflexi bacterium]|nr:hypothetical protein [Chloroflexota bacterium]